ncbi:hypothetical protein SI65_08860 [Aspergillus cristatus]|uniref:DUF7703 domain-containing protein n=1 Tax=Aspergillus cristatus TaxID=573508 RepID=A0A1E3B5C9_ASPCR|nr:hypothetical protein SI65_08860 [Aspergillus cristatus]
MQEQVLSRPATEAGLCLMVAFFSVAGYNALEIFFSIFEIFKRRRGLYFWSMLAATWGIPLNVIFSITSIFTLIPVIPSVIGYLLGYYLMSVSPLIVLYSRLHFVISNPRRLRWILYGIIALSSVIIVSMTIFISCQVAGLEHFRNYRLICWNVTMTCLCVTEVTVSGVYVREAVVNLKPVLRMKGQEGRKLILHLVALYIYVIILLGIFLILIYSHHYVPVLGYHSLVYSIKLKTEFAILNKLICLVRTSTDSFQNPQPPAPNALRNIRFDGCQSILNQTPQRDSDSSTSKWTSKDDIETAEKRSCG